MKKIYLNWTDVQGKCIEICRQMQLDGWMPDYVVGITRGGSVPAVLISQYLNVPCEMLKVSLRDVEDTESNCWMAEDAFGYVPTDTVPRPKDMIVSDPKRRKNILIIDDINDTGRTLRWIKEDWEKSCMPHSEDWNDVWHHNVQFATIVENIDSTFKGVDYYGMEINKFEDPCWVIFPWEEWWHQTAK